MKMLFSVSVIAVGVFFGSTAMSTCQLKCRNTIYARFLVENVVVGPSFQYCEAYPQLLGGKYVKTDYLSDGVAVQQIGQTLTHQIPDSICSQTCWTAPGETLNNVEAMPVAYLVEDIISTYYIQTCSRKADSVT